jgi:transposase
MIDNGCMSYEHQASKMTTKEVAKLLQSFDSLNQELDNSKEKLSNQEAKLANQEATLSNQKAKILDLDSQLKWFKNQIFGEKTERRLLESDSNEYRQLPLFEDAKKRETPPAEEETVGPYQRKKSRQKDPLEGTPKDSGLRFNENEVPVKEINIPNPITEGLSPDQYEVLGSKVTYRLAQRPASYVVLKYVRETVKLKETNKLVTPPAPQAVFDKSYADVSLLAGLLTEKFLYHLPLYRQHQRLTASHIMLSRATLTNFVHRAANLLEPVYYAVLSSILESKVLLMDETPIKAGIKKAGKMKLSYFWPVFGDKNEVAFPFSTSRRFSNVKEILSEWCGVLVTDGYKAYEKYASTVNGVIHAECWAHTRRYFIKAEKVEPEHTKKIIDLIRKIYKDESLIKKKGLEGSKKLEARSKHILPIVNEYFAYLKKVSLDMALLPSSPFTKALNYSLEREKNLRVFLEFPDIPPDTNEIERMLRPIPMGRKAWLFAWTEVGAKYVGIIQTLIQSCRLQGVDPYVYLVDVLQRVESHPIREVNLLTPRLWKENFARDPLTSDLD